MNERELPALSFPVIENETNPVQNCSLDECDIEQEFFFTIPMTALRPAPCTLNESEDTQFSFQMKTILMFWAKLVQQMFYAADEKKIKNDDGVERIRIYMEYLLSKDSDINDFQIIDCVGIRFRIQIIDNTIDIDHALLKLISLNREENVKLKKSRKNTSDYKPYEYYKNIDDIIKWLMFCNTYTGKKVHINNITDNMMRGGDELTPSVSHPLHIVNVFTWEHSLVDHMHPLQTTESEDFGIPSAVYKFTHALFNPLSLLTVTLPRSFRWSRQSITEFRNTIDSLLNPAFMKRYFTDYFIKRNDLKDLLVVQRAKYKRIIESDIPQDEKIEKLRKFRERSTEYIQKIWSPSSNVSNPIKIMSAWARKYDTWTTKDNVVIDKKLSYFGNMIANEFLTLEKNIKFATTHTIMFRVLINSMNAYWYKRSLHNNVALLGKGAAGKSHIFNEIERILIEGTVKKISHSTSKSNAVDTDNNDHITFYHEMPPVFLGKTNDKAQETGDHLLKDMLTDCKVVTETIFVDQDSQRRLKVECESEVTGVVCMAFNGRFDIVPEALASRLITIIVNEYIREKFGVQQKSMNIFDKEFDTSYNVGENDYIQRWRFRQLMTNMIEKMIYENILKDVNMSICNHMFNTMITFMKKEGIIYNNSDTIRGTKFLRNFARTLTIIHAVDKFANDPQSPGYNKEITFKNLFEIQPYLVCNEEISLFAFSMCLDQLINMDHFRVMELLLYSCKDFFELDYNTGETIIDPDGFISTKPVFSGFGTIYKRLAQAQNSGVFDVKLSEENIKVAFSQIKQRSYKSQPIIDFNQENRIIRINKKYIDEKFVLNNDTGKYVSKFDSKSIVEYIFHEAYSHKYMRERRIILGTIYDLNFPFVFDVLDIKANKNNILEIHDPDFDYLKHQNEDNDEEEEDEEEDGVIKANSMIIYKKDFEDYIFKQYTTQTGFGNQMTVNQVMEQFGQKSFYNELLSVHYPENLVYAFCKSHGIGVKNKRKLDTSIIVSEFEYNKKQKRI